MDGEAIDAAASARSVVAKRAAQADPSLVESGPQSPPSFQSLKESNIVPRSRTAAPTPDATDAIRPGHQ